MVREREREEGGGWTNDDHYLFLSTSCKKEDYNYTLR